MRAKTKTNKKQNCERLFVLDGSPRRRGHVALLLQAVSNPIHSSCRHVFFRLDSWHFDIRVTTKSLHHTRAAVKKWKKQKQFHYKTSLKRKAIVLVKSKGNRAVSQSLGIWETCVHGRRSQKGCTFDCKAKRQGLNGPPQGRFLVQESSPSSYVKGLRPSQQPVSSDIVEAKSLRPARSSEIP